MFPSPDGERRPTTRTGALQISPTRSTTRQRTQVVASATTSVVAPINALSSRLIKGLSNDARKCVRAIDLLIDLIDYDDVGELSLNEAIWESKQAAAAFTRAAKRLATERAVKMELRRAQQGSLPVAP